MHFLECCNVYLTIRNEVLIKFPILDIFSIMFFTYFDVYNLRDIVADEHHPIQILDE
jgi:hypothetical protein